MRKPDTKARRARRKLLRERRELEQGRYWNRAEARAYKDRRLALHESDGVLEVA